MATGITFEIEKVDSCEGIYLKWYSNHDGWLYFLFNEKRKDTISVRSRGQLFNDFENAEDAVSPFVSLGKTGSNKIKLHATGLEQYERDIIETIIDSPKVYLFKGTKGVLATALDWLEVEVVTNSYLSQNYGKLKFNTEVDIEVNRNTMTL